MGLTYCAGFQVGGTNTMTGSVNGDPYTITAGFYLPGSLATASIVGATYTGQAYSPLATELAARLNALHGPGFTVTMSATTGLYTIASSAGVFTLEFSTAADLRLRAALGFTGDKSGADTYTSDFVPTYSMQSAIDGRTDYMPPMEPDDIAEETVSDGGVAYVITRKTSELLCSWTQQMEPFTSCSPRARTEAALSTWTWREFFEHTRGTHPFWCSEDLPGENGGAIYQLTAKGAAYQGRLFTADFLDYTGVPFKTRWLGALA